MFCTKYYKGHVSQTGDIRNEYIILIRIHERMFGKLWRRRVGIYVLK